MSSVYRVALTGGIACGKSTVANLFAALGASLVDTDLLAREVVLPGSSLLREIARHFGAKILSDDGSLNRQELRERIFADPAERKWLETLTHPAIRELTDQRSQAATGPYVVVAIPLLVETGGTKRFDHVLVVDCDPELQIARLAARDGNSRQQAERILAAQASRVERLAIADDVINNDGDIASLRDQVGKLHRQFVRASIVKSEWAQSDKDAL
jgi:dephospho-CoA kinase